jgi:hypothetical protein
MASGMSVTSVETQGATQVGTSAGLASWRASVTPFTHPSQLPLRRRIYGSVVFPEWHLAKRRHLAAACAWLVADDRSARLCEARDTTEVGEKGRETPTDVVMGRGEAHPQVTLIVLSLGPPRSHLPWQPPVSCNRYPVASGCHPLDRTCGWGGRAFREGVA